MPERKPFNPIAIPNIALNLALEVLEQTAHPLPPVHRPVGAGVYLLYYRGNFEPYLPFQEPNRAKLPIYVGKADRKGMRKGFKFDPPQAHEISGRLRAHINSITLASNLELSDFFAVTSLWRIHSLALRNRSWCQSLTLFGTEFLMALATILLVLHEKAKPSPNGINFTLVGKEEGA